MSEQLLKAQRYLRQRGLYAIEHSPARSHWHAADLKVPGSRVLAEWSASRKSKPTRMYAGAKIDRLSMDWQPQSTSHDSELVTSLRTLRNRSRQLVRDNEYAKQALRVIRNNVIGQGVRMQSQATMRRGGKLDEKTNDAIQASWRRWCRANSCHVAGKMSFADIERMVFTSMPESGELLVRLVRQRFGDSRVPLALEVIEADQLVDTFSVNRLPNGNQVRMGVEVDKWQRPLAYWLYPYHPGDFQFTPSLTSSDYLRVPASEVLHLFVADRPLATRGVPWFHAALSRLNNMRGYEEAEIVAARASAAVMGFIQSPEPENAMTDDGVMAGERVVDFSPGEIKELGPGETFQGFNPSRPNSALEPFMRFMLRAVAAGTGVSYESLSLDYSQSNFSSSRMALLADRDNWRVLQDWVIEHFHQRVFDAWLESAVLSGELNLPFFLNDPDSYTSVRWSPRGWGYIDPWKDALGEQFLIRAGLKTQTQALAERGEDFNDWLRQRRREMDQLAENALVVDSDSSQVSKLGVAQPNPAPQETDLGQPISDAPPDPSGDGDQSGSDTP